MERIWSAENIQIPVHVLVFLHHTCNTRRTSSNSRALHKQALTVQPLHIFSFRLQRMQCAGGYGKCFSQLKQRGALDT
ncbi:hypothetical protein L873DRAFT_1799155 [Choiromyces venosus 120613-1]|uniref:Uncharacterized protein n=1 Tax=Choiromyces venosus 120613-1 TaxID=1336337 RepID=A0A3N4K2F1_9PEZI|nr:hypothetical protein L873DRAFT_1799155 [Choiromyces venosus 120613-1]